MQENILQRMQEDMRRTVQQKGKIRWAMLIDVHRCVGCHACTIACMSAFLLPIPPVLRPVREEEQGFFPHVSRNFIPKPCLQCLEPACVPVCLVGATHRDSEGITRMNTAACIGCGLCVKACPYGGRVLHKGSEHRVPIEHPVLLGHKLSCDGNIPPYDRKKVYKCEFCQPRLREGLLPLCVTSCMSVATIFGNSADPQSLISTLIKEKSHAHTAVLYGGQYE